jgi:poly-gamma-glutamate synthesis protein (capsule biosynthesis protein)
MRKRNNKKRTGRFFLTIFITMIIVSVAYVIKNKKSISVGFTGDVMIGRLVNQAITTYGYDYPWGNTLALLKENDFNIINLESTLTKSEKRVFKVFNFKADPDKVKTLVNANISLVNLANNHSLDFNAEGLEETLKTLEANKIKQVGVGQDIKQARKMEILEKSDIKIGVLGYTDNEPEWVATPEKPGINYIKVGKIEQIEYDIKSARKLVDVLVVSIHWGPNKTERPSPDFVEFAHKIIDCGADVIHGHSAHVFQGIEIYKGKVIMYSTGDFIDDYMVYPDLHNDHSFLFRLNITKSGVKKIELIPVYISEMQVNLAKDNLAKKILNHMKKLSAEFGTEVEIMDNRGFISVTR